MPAGVCQRQFGSVKKLPFQAEAFAKLPIKIKIAVLIVHDNRMTELGEVQADLMQAAGIEAHFD